jgi:hypothetical protein
VRRPAIVVALMLAVWPSGRLAAQTDARLVEALRLAQSGQIDSGRAIVRRVLATLQPSDSVYPQALLAAAKIAPDANVVSSNLNRIVVDYGSSAWADDALLLLTQLYYAQHDPARTIDAAERLIRDYPDSPLRSRASFSAARSYFELKNETRGCELIQQSLGGADSSADVEFKNQVSFYAARCSPTSTSTTAAPVDTSKATPPTSARGYSVQVLAVKSAAQVDDMLTRLKVMGFTARVVRDSAGFFKVRVGPYPTREEAARTQQRLKTRVGGQPFVVEEL